MPRQIAARVFLVCAILLAQQTALAHDLWHGANPSSPSQKSGKLCDLHDLLGTVLGAVSAPKIPAELLSFGEALCPCPAAAPAQSRPSTPQSRSPPALS